MVRFDGRMLALALQTLLLGCGSGSHQPERPATVPSPAVQPRTSPHTSPADPKPEPKKAPKDSGGGGEYPWQSGPIAAL